jgi:MFS family permease
MTEATAAKTGIPKSDRLVIIASSLGTVFEWYDFFLYGILATLLGQLFFPADNPTASNLASLVAFGIGFGVRPLGAIIFGILGDKVGRKYTFLITISLMGGATAAIGLLPTYAQAGYWAPVLLLTMRLIQGLALGGEYGGAAIYVAEHAPKGQRGYYTSWIQVSVPCGFLLCLLVVLTCWHTMSDEAFKSWGWRIPFLLSLLMLAISIYIRLKLKESPVFQAMKASGTTSQNPFRESFSTWENTRLMIVAMFGVAAGLTVIYYTSQFGMLYFLQNTARVAQETALLYLAVGAAIAAPLYVIFGKMSDKYGRKRILLIGYALTLVLLFPTFQMLSKAANPALARATSSSPVTIGGAECSFAVFAPKQKTPCAKMLALLTKRGIAYEKVGTNSDIDVEVTIGKARVTGFDEKRVVDALIAAGYPDKANPAEQNHFLIILAVATLVSLSAMTYGMVAAIFVELFPARIRYTSMSISYHIGTGYFGGFLPVISQYIVVKTGGPFDGLWYTFGVVLFAFIISWFYLPETNQKDIDA